MRPSSGNWKSTPGNFDPLHTADEMTSGNSWGVPDLEGVTAPLLFDWTQTFVQYRTQRNKARPFPPGRGLVNFFTEDYRFEQVWSTPAKLVLEAEHWSLTPDFSVYTDHPAAVHLWNIFRSRWLGAFWQRAGMKIIPTVAWARAESYAYSFLGLPSNAVLAVSTVGIHRDHDARELWVRGFNEMIARLSPVHVICYGKFPTGFQTSVSHQILEPYYGKF